MPPREYTLLIEMRDLGVGYYAGGLRDQPAGVMRKALTYELVIESVKRWRAMRLKDFERTASQSMRDAVEWVLQLRRDKRKQEKNNG